MKNNENEIPKKSDLDSLIDEANSCQSKLLKFISTYPEVAREQLFPFAEILKLIGKFEILIQLAKKSST